MKTIRQQIALIKKGAVEIIQENELKSKLERAIKVEKPLIIKAGFDPTVPDIHLGHTVLLRKLRHFQDLGHKVVFLIGDATALVGDPSGQSQTRKTLTWDEVEKNARTYVKQVSKILNTKDYNLFELKYNSKWFNKSGQAGKTPHFTFEKFVEIAQSYTIARLLERDDFQKRLKENKPISFLELFYPLMQGYDSVRLNADVEIGGTDQKFNMLVGRNLQQTYKNQAIDGYSKEPQVVITMPLLEGLDGVQKMSKSLGNYVSINEPPKDMFGKLMSISDELMYRYYELLTDEDVDAIKEEVAGNRLHPKKAKSNLAKIIVTQYCSKEQAEKEEQNFEMTFKEKKTPEDVPRIAISLDEINIIELLMRVGFCDSRAEAKRLVRQGGVIIEGEKVKDINSKVKITKEPKVLRAGRLKFIKVYGK